MGNQAIAQYKDSSFIIQNDLESNLTVQSTYAFTNENLRQYIDLLNIAGGRVATVGSSGDQVFYSVFKDAEEVTLIDGNPYAKPMVELKKSAILNMSYDEFMRYWSKDLILNALDTKELLGDMSNGSRKFFEYILEEMKYKKYFNVVDGLVNDESFEPIYYGFRPISHSVGCEFYDNKRKYNKLKNKLTTAKINYALAEFNQFPEKLRGKYNSIILSNIWDYVDEGSYSKVTDSLIENQLENHGTMQMHYEFGSTPDFIEYYSGLKGTRKDINCYLIQDQIRFDEERKGFAKIFMKKRYPKQLDNESSVIGNGNELVYIYEK